MFRKEEVEKILAQARRMDPQLEMSGVSEHQYRLKPPVDLAFVRAVEKEYLFQFPEDYVQFITEVGDGGAGPGYGLYSFGFYRTETKNARDAKRRDTYLRRLSRDLPYGFFHLGTYGCARDYGLITAGERSGQVFINDIEGDFELKADSFQTFYQEWLDFILDTERFQKELDMWRSIRNR